METDQLELGLFLVIKEKQFDSWTLFSLVEQEFEFVPLVCSLPT